MAGISDTELVQTRVQNFLNMYTDGALFNHEPAPPLTTMRALPLMCWAVLEVRKLNRKLLDRTDELQGLFNVTTLERDLARAEAATFVNHLPADSADAVKEELEPIYAEFATKIPHEYEPGSTIDDTEVCVKCGLSYEDGPHG